jgi:hypothetical protein
LHCALTSRQSADLDCVLQAAAEIEEQEREQEQEREHSYEKDSGAAGQHEKLDKACLLLCIALLDHPLRGNIYDGIIIIFLAILGITSKGSFHDAPTYTTCLSALIKTAQVLVVERALLAVKKDKADHFTNIFNAMQERFIAFSTCSPMDWAHKLQRMETKDP